MELNLYLIIVSDRVSSGQKQDKTRDRVEGWCKQNPIILIKTEIIPDEKIRIGQCLKAAINNKECHLIITSGGTGLSAQDITPEATLPFLEKLTPGIDEYLRREGTKDTPFSILSRGISGVAKNKIIINLPGNPDAVISALNILKDILPHALKTIEGTVKDTEHKFRRDHS